MPTWRSRVDVAADHRSVTFVLRPEARFSDGTPVLASDVVWSFDTLREQGRPNYRTYWADVADAQAPDARTVVFHFKTADNRELPQILGEVPVLPEHWWKGRDFLRAADRPAGGQRRLHGRPGGSRPHHHLPPRPGLVGGRSCRPAAG